MAVKNIAGWDTHHDWVIRDQEMDSGSPVMLHQCRRCGRNFVMELLTGDQYAVHVGAMRFNRLSEETTSRCWPLPVQANGWKVTKLIWKREFSLMVLNPGHRCRVAARAEPRHRQRGLCSIPSIWFLTPSFSASGPVLLQRRRVSQLP